mgnify:CR=1 FL=1
MKLRRDPDHEIAAVFFGRQWLWNRFAVGLQIRHHIGNHLANAMQRRFRELKPGWAARGMDVGLGIGINEGPVVLGHVGGRARMNYAMVGQAVNLAHRLVELAGDGQIVVAPEVVAGGLPDAPGLSIRGLPPRALKGAEQPQAMVLLELEG